MARGLPSGTWINRLARSICPPAPRILPVEDREGLADHAAPVLARVGLAADPRPARGPAAVGAALDAGAVDLAVLVRDDPITLCEAVLRAVRIRRLDVPCIVVSTAPCESPAVEVMRAGAADDMTADALVRLPVAAARQLRERGERAARRRAEAAYSGLNDRLTGLQRATDALAVVIAHEGGTVPEWGEGAHRMLGYAAEAVVGRADLTIGHDAAELSALADGLGAGSPLEALMAGARDGVAVPRDRTFMGQSESAGELLRLAEGALYWAKQHGRDVAFIYSPEVVEELSAEERADRLQRVQALQSIRVLARAVDAKGPSTQQHSERVAVLAVAIGTAPGWDSDRLVRLRQAGLVHDVGKIGVPDRILLEEGRLTPSEYEEITRHAEIGAEMVFEVLSSEQVGRVRGRHE